MNENQKDRMAKIAAACAAHVGEDLKPADPPQLQFFHGLAWILAHLLKSPRLLLGAAKQAEAYLPKETAEGVPT